MSTQHRGRKPGTKIKYSVPNTARYRSQWLRYQRAKFLTPEQVGPELFHCYGRRSPDAYWIVSKKASGSSTPDSSISPTAPPYSPPTLPLPKCDPGPANGDVQLVYSWSEITVRQLWSSYPYLDPATGEPTYPTVDQIRSQSYSSGFTSVTHQVSDYRFYAAARAPFPLGRLDRVDEAPTISTHGDFWWILQVTRTVFTSLFRYGPDPDGASPCSNEPPTLFYIPSTPKKHWVCNCPDYAQVQAATNHYPSERVDREWSSSNAGTGRIGSEQQPCKHILAVKLLLNEPIEVQPDDFKQMERWGNYVKSRIAERRKQKLARLKRSRPRSTGAYKRYQRQVEQMGLPSQAERQQMRDRRKQIQAAKKARRQAFQNYYHSLWEGYKKAAKKDAYTSQVLRRLKDSTLQPHQIKAINKFLDKLPE